MKSLTLYIWKASIGCAKGMAFLNRKFFPHKEAHK